MGHYGAAGVLAGRTARDARPAIGQRADTT